MLNKETIKQIALSCGFKLKEQANGEMDLNPYVYEFANAIAEHCWSSFKSGVMPHKIHPTKASLNNGWIGTDDELLKQYANKEILIYVCDTVKKTIYSVDGGHYIDDDGKEYQYVHWFSDEFGDFMWEFDEVKYWQPLPQPPKE